jgi:hypothetical protein
MVSGYVFCSYVRWIREYSAGLVTNGLGYGGGNGSKDIKVNPRRVLRALDIWKANAGDA